MKKYILILLALVLALAMTACASGSEDERTLETFRNAFTEAGIVLEDEDVPFYAMIGAKDGFLFYIDGQKVAVYEFATERNLQDSVLISDWPANGRFALETSNAKVIGIFNEVE